MLKAAIKFCGGCNPRYDRGQAYEILRSRLAGIARFSLPQEGEPYDVLVILRGCTGCPYLYEEIHAKARVICASLDELDDAIYAIENLTSSD